MPNAVPELLRLDEQLCFPLYAATRAMMQLYQPLLRELDLTYPQYLVMLVLWESDGPSVKQLGERLFLDSGTLTPLLKRLEAAGLVARERSAVDERVVHARLTPEGRALERRASRVPYALACRLEMSGPELLALRAQLHSLYTRVRGLVEGGESAESADSELSEAGPGAADPA